MKRLLCAAALLLAPLQATTYFVTVAGLGGENDYTVRFTNLASEIDKIVRASGPDVQVETLLGGVATKARLQAVLNGFGKSATAQDTLVISLIGHGSYDGHDYKMNLVGPDLSAGELAGMLDRVPAGRQLVVNMTSASGACLPVLQKANRTVITATKTGNEKNATVFARYWVEALRDSAADADKNETISALEAFRYADAKTQEFYETQKRLATEHAMLQDAGQGSAVRNPSPQNGQGLGAARLGLLKLGALQASAKTPAKQKLLAKREELERRIDELKYKKAAMPADEYRREIGAALLDLARTQAEIDKE